MINDGHKPLINFVIAQAGSAFALLDYAIENELSLNEVLTPGQILEKTIYAEVEPDNFNEIITTYLQKEESVNVVSGQSICDVAIQEMGSCFKLFELALENELSLNDIMLPGRKLIIPQIEKDNDIVNHFKGQGITISTYKTGSLTPEESYELPGEFPFSF